MAHFADINISQGSVATYARCSGIFNMHLTADLPRNLPVKKFSKSVKISQNYGHESVAQFFSSTLYIYTRSCTLRLCMTKHRPSHRHIHVQTFPYIVCLLFNSGAAASVKKNWLPLSWAPAFAIATRPRRTKRRREWNSSCNQHEIYVTP